MDKLFESETGRKVMVNMCKEKAGDFAEECLSKLGGGGGGGGAESQEDKGFDVGDILQMVGGKKDDKKGFDMGDVLQMAGGKKEDKKGFDVTDVLSMAGGKQEDSGAGIGKALSGLFD